jgi:hypothetical protein
MAAAAEVVLRWLDALGLPPDRNWRLAIDEDGLTLVVISPSGIRYAEYELGGIPVENGEPG